MLCFWEAGAGVPLPSKMRSGSGSANLFFGEPLEVLPLHALAFFYFFYSHTQLGRHNIEGLRGVTLYDQPTNIA